MKRKPSKPDQIENATTLATEYSDAVDKLVMACTKLAEIVQNVEKLRLRRDKTLLSALTTWDSLTAAQQVTLAQLVQAVGDKTARDVLQSVSAQAIDVAAHGVSDASFKTPNSNEERK